MSTVKTNTLTGTTSAGSIVVTGEGGSTTTNMQQGLAKNWVNCSDSGVNNDSFNTSGITDAATGKYDVALTNNMANTTYHYNCANVKSGDNSPQAGINGSLATTGYRLEATNYTSYLDPDQATGSTFGDLA